MLAQAQAATSPDEILADPVLEQRARGLAKQLRCLVCQNQSIDDSDAELAHDLRALVREQLQAGESDQEILAFLTARYGDFVLLKPPVEACDLGPVVRSAGAAAGGRRRHRRLSAPALLRGRRPARRSAPKSAHASMR